MRVLIVDDAREIRQALRAYLMAHVPGTEVLEAGDGTQALALASTPIDVVLTDFLMPGMDGLELLAAWHEIQPGTQGILMTAYPDAYVAARAVAQLGPGHVLAKPFEPWQVVEAVAPGIAGATWSSEPVAA